ncbi:MAG: hypothetical protein ABI663_01110, partial [Chryseolinea sp.]
AKTNIILQSKDGGQTWQDITNGLPENEQPEDFFVGKSEVYLRVNNEMYHSKSNLKTPVWEKENVSDLKSKSESAWPPLRLLSIVPESWPSTHSMRSVFETSDGTIFLGYDREFYKSIDKGKNWKKILDQGGGDMVESEGVLLATGTKGIKRSTDNGENWQWVISEGGVGIAVERIDGGFAAISFNTTTNSRRIRISLDGGKTWTAIDEGLQPSLSISSIKQVGKYLLCGHPDGIFRSSDMGKTWKMVHPSVDNAIPIFLKASNITPSNDNRKVFKIYVSGNVLYAVARNSGC